MNFIKVSPYQFVKVMKNIPLDKKPFLTMYSGQEYTDMGATCYLSADRQSGYALVGTSDTYIELISAFSLNHKGTGVIQSAIQNGAHIVECFDGALVKFYNKHGFVQYDSVAWDDRYAPVNWDKLEYGTPDVIFLEHYGKVNK